MKTSPFVSDFPVTARPIVRGSISAANTLGYGLNVYSVFEGLEDETDWEKFRERLLQKLAERPTAEMFSYVAALRNVPGFHQAPQILRDWAADPTKSAESRALALDALTQCDPSAAAQLRVALAQADTRQSMCRSCGDGPCQDQCDPVVPRKR